MTRIPRTALVFKGSKGFCGKLVIKSVWFTSLVMLNCSSVTVARTRTHTHTPPHTLWESTGTKSCTKVQHFYNPGRHTLGHVLQICSCFWAVTIAGSSAESHKGPCSHSYPPPENRAQDETKKIFKWLLQRQNIVKGFGSKLPFARKHWFDSL